MKTWRVFQPTFVIIRKNLDNMLHLCLQWVANVTEDNSLCDLQSNTYRWIEKADGMKVAYIICF